ncbi:TSUP family transporter [Niveispirillum sp.]|uniref:TSUP family transporter n=1 Tax=Niveispirillum sp. TaxID=1917217 RepID=UPI001B6A3B0F|nr:TSUP family transporter [Niveispirillum sp.]MBP7337663.1 TSUP family transporter [Niveispirillum sp.]
MQDPILIICLVAVLAVVQSVFGMGVLIFGTPTLLLLGLPFGAALGWLLPASATISLLQVLEAPHQARIAWRGLRPLWCIGILVPVLALSLHLQLRFRLELAIGIAMCGAALLRLSPALRSRLQGAIKRSERGYLLAMGALHGFTNMGGSLLSLYAASTASGKEAVRGVVSNYYLTFGLFQLAVLALFQPETLTGHSLLSAGVGFLVHWCLGRRVFSGLGGNVYDRALTSFIGLYGIALLVKAQL